MDHRRRQTTVVLAADWIAIGERRHSLEELVDRRRRPLGDARSFAPGAALNQRWQIAMSLRTLFNNQSWPRAHVWDANAP